MLFLRSDKLFLSSTNTNTQCPGGYSRPGVLRTILSPHIVAIRRTLGPEFIVLPLPFVCRCHAQFSPLFLLQVWFIEHQVCFSIDRTRDASELFDLDRQSRPLQFVSLFNM